MKQDQEFPWKRSEIITLLRHIAESDPYEEDHFSCDYCKYCRARIGNARLAIKEGARETNLHESDCVWLLANDMLTGITENKGPNT